MKFNGSRTLRTTLAAVGVSLLASTAHAATPAELLAAYSKQAGGNAQAPRGKAFFGERHGRELSCASCHGTPPVQAGKHAATGEAIAAMAPAVNPERFTDSAKAEKWFHRNCNDVAGRECTPAEKADVLAWLLTLKP